MKQMKSDIIQIGTFDKSGEPLDWIFKGGSTGISLDDDFSPVRWGGYTLAELREISGEDRPVS